MYVICKYYIKIQRDGETLWSLHRESNKEFIDIAAHPLESGLDLWLFRPTECGKSDTVPVWNPVLKKLGVSISFLESDAMPFGSPSRHMEWFILMRNEVLGWQFSADSERQFANHVSESPCNGSSRTSRSTPNWCHLAQRCLVLPSPTQTAKLEQIKDYLKPLNSVVVWCAAIEKQQNRYSLRGSSSLEKIFTSLNLNLWPETVSSQFDVATSYQGFLLMALHLDWETEIVTVTPNLKICDPGNTFSSLYLLQSPCS